MPHKGREPLMIPDPPHTQQIKHKIKQTALQVHVEEQINALVC
jgi:hypothetical protein